MDLINKNNDNYYGIVKHIVHDKDTRKIIHRMSNYEIYDMSCYLDNKLYYQLGILVEKVIKTIPEKYTLELFVIIDNFIKYHYYCLEKNISMTDVLFITKSLLMKAGAKKNKNVKTENSTSEQKNIITQRITLTMRSILERKFDKNKIDDNLRLGAKERKEHILKLKQQKLSKKNVDHKKKIQPKHTPKKPTVPIIKKDVEPKPNKPINKINPLDVPLSPALSEHS